MTVFRVALSVAAAVAVSAAGLAAVQAQTETPKNVQAASVPAPGFLKKAADDIDSAAVKDLLQKGAVADEKDSDGMTPLMVVCSGRMKYTDDSRKKQIEIVKSLIAAGADINARDINGDSPVLLAVSGVPNLELVSLLAGKGADLSILDKKGFSVMGRVSISSPDWEKILKLLASKGVKPNAQDLKKANMMQSVMKGKYQSDAQRFYSALVSYSR